MITKEERAELRKIVASVTLLFPWEAVEATVLSGESEFIAECDEDDEECLAITTLIASAANALPKILATLDAADERIAELEKDCDIYQDANIRLTKEFEQERAALTRKNRALKHEIRKLYRAREQDWEAGKRWRKEFLEFSERLLSERREAERRIAELEAAAQWRPIEEAPKDGREVLVTYRNRSQVQFADYSGHKWWQRGPGREPLIPQPTHYLAIPALPEGGV